MCSASFHIAGLLEKMASSDKDFRCGTGPCGAGCAPLGQRAGGSPSGPGGAAGAGQRPAGFLLRGFWRVGTAEALAPCTRLPLRDSLVGR